MTRIDVVPNGKKWKVKGRGTSNHRKKSTAKKKARKRGKVGDQVYVRNKNGKISDSFKITES